MINAVFGKTEERIRKQRDTEIVATDKRRNQLVSETNYHTTIYFSEHLMVIDMKKTKIKRISRSILACQYYTLAKHLCINFGMITLNQNLKTKKNYVKWIRTALLFILKLKIFVKILLMTLKNGLRHITKTKMIKAYLQ